VVIYDILISSENWASNISIREVIYNSVYSVNVMARSDGKVMFSKGSHIDVELGI
jgi:hypothetical protein